MLNHLLAEYFSPEQISGRLKLELGVEISHETICRGVSFGENFAFQG